MKFKPGDHMFADGCYYINETQVWVCEPGVPGQTLIITHDRMIGYSSFAILQDPQGSHKDGSPNMRKTVFSSRSLSRVLAPLPLISHDWSYGEGAQEEYMASRIGWLIS